MSGFKFPSPADRVSIIGSTGSGKTRFAAWMHSHSPFHVRPYVILDFKGDDLLMRIERARQITVKDTPKHPGLYYMRPMRGQDEEMESFLERIWRRGNVGIYLDEGYMINPRSPMFNTILTQGRSLKIPAIVLTQRPKICSRMVFSEASMYALFRMNDRRDVMDAVGSFTPRDNPVWDISSPLDDYHCRWYDATRDYSAIIQPVPGDAEILQRYSDALRVRAKGL